MNRITTYNLVTWAATRECQQYLPLLVRKLIRASPVTLQRMLIPAGDNVVLPGYDGTVETSNEYEYVPEGVSVWEIGTNKDFNAKAEKDLAKRSKAVSAKFAAETCFVFVTPRIWDGREKWVEEKNKTKIWKDVRVIDGVVLEEWIEQFPVVGAWLARLIGLPFGNLQPLEEFWNEWKENIKFRINAELVVAGRERQVKELSDFLLGKAGINSVRASTPEEAVAFIAATVHVGGEEFSDSVFSKAVLVDNETDFRLVSAQKTPVILVTRFHAGTLADQAVKNGHHVILPVGNDVTASGSAIELPQIRRDLFEKQLQDMGLTNDQANQLTRDSGQSLSVLRRLMDFERNYQPAWAKDGHHVDLIPALLAGSWDEEKEADKALIVLLAGEPYEKYLAKLSRWKFVKDPPLFQIGPIWHFTSYLDAWSVLAAFLTRPDLENFKNAFLGSLPEINPALELTPDQRWLANIHGKKMKFSSKIREGLCQSLILIAVFGERFKLTATNSHQGYADALVMQLLENADGDRWNSLSRILPLLAEASPREFLHGVEKSLCTADKPVMRMFGDVGTNPLFSNQYFTWLLWALENLLYSKEYLLKATLLLGRFASIAPKHEISNSPLQTLTALFVVWYRQTDAELEIRKTVLAKLAEKEPNTAWDLFVELMPNSRGSVSPINRCRWRWDSHQLERQVSMEEVYDMYNFLMEQMILLAKGNERRAAKLISMLPSVDLERRKKLREFLRTEKESSDHSENIIWQKLRRFLSLQRDPIVKENAMPPYELQEMEELFELYTPIDPVIPNLYLFENEWIDTVDGVSVRSMEHSAKEELVNAKRLFVFKELYDLGGVTAISNLIPRLTRPNILSHISSKFGLTENDETIIISWLSLDHEDKYNQFAQAYTWSRSWTGELPWIKMAWDTVQQQTKDPNIHAQFFLSIPLNIKNWELQESAEAEVQKVYWSKVVPYISSEQKVEMQYAIKKLMEAGRFITIINNMAYESDDLSSELLCEVMLKAVTTQAEPNVNFDYHHINTLFEKLHLRTDVDLKLLAQLEWLYLPVFSYLTGYQPKTLHKELTDNPDFFVEVVTYVYMPDERTEENYTEETLQEYFKKSDSGRKLLEGWNRIPGMADDGSVDKIVLAAWVNKAIEKGKGQNRVYGVDRELGKLFGCYPRKSTENWPPDSICEIMEDINSDTVFSSFSSEIFNSRGMYGKRAYEGGSQERGLAAFFETAAKRIESKYPGTAGVLRDLSRSYTRDAKEQDDRAKLDQLR